MDKVMSKSFTGPSAQFTCGPLREALRAHGGAEQELKLMAGDPRVDLELEPDVYDDPDVREPEAVEGDYQGTDKQDEVPT
jgi:hypothetical protein